MQKFWQLAIMFAFSSLCSISFSVCSVAAELSNQRYMHFKNIPSDEISTFSLMLWLLLEEIPGIISISSIKCFFFHEFSTVISEWECQSILVFILVLCQLNLSLSTDFISLQFAFCLDIWVSLTIAFFKKMFVTCLPKTGSMLNGNVTWLFFS